MTLLSFKTRIGTFMYFRLTDSARDKSDQKVRRNLIIGRRCLARLIRASCKGQKLAGQPDTDVWAPDVIKARDRKYWLYYSMSRWGSQHHISGAKPIKLRVLTIMILWY